MNILKVNFKVGIICFLLLFHAGCAYKYPSHIPTGKWTYKLFINGSYAGHASFKCEIKDTNYVSTSYMEMSAGKITNISKLIIVEKQDFTPVRYESNNTIINNRSKQEINTKADCKGPTIHLTMDNKKAIVKMNKDYHLEGVYLLHRLIQEKFKVGANVEYTIYNPTIELETGIKVKVSILGMESVEINNSSKSLIHISQALEGVRSIDSFLDEKGIMHKTVMQMLNTIIVLIKE